MKITFLTLIGAFTLAQGVAAPQGYIPRGQITYEATGPMGKFKGTNKALSGNLTWDREAGSIKGKVCVAQKEWGSGEAIRDNHTKGMFEVDKFPTACLQLEKLEGDPGKGAFTLAGTLSMHGVNLPVKIPASAKLEGGKVMFEGKFATKITDWKMEPPGLLGVKVGDDVTVMIAAEATVE